MGQDVSQEPGFLVLADVDVFAAGMRGGFAVGAGAGAAGADASTSASFSSMPVPLLVVNPRSL